MLPLKKRRFASLMLGTLLLGAAACGDEGGSSDDSFVAPVNNGGNNGNNAGAPDAGGTQPPASNGGASNPGAGSGLDAGGSQNNPPPQPQPDAAAAVDTGAPQSDSGSTGSDASTMSDGGSAGADGGASEGSCCPDGKCLCHGPVPMALTSGKGPFKTASYTVSGAGCVFYPTDAEPPYAAVAISDGFQGAGGCNSFQTGQWGPFYASWGIVAMIVNTGTNDQPNQRATALAKGIEAFKSENMKSGGPLSGKLAGRYGTSGFSMGGGGTTIAASKDKTLLTDVAIMPWGPTNSGVTVPTLVVCGGSDNVAPCTQHGTPAYRGIADTVPKMRIQINSGHAGQPSSGMGVSGQVGLAFQKVFLEGDTRWRPLLVGAKSEETNIK